MLLYRERYSGVLLFTDRQGILGQTDRGEGKASSATTGPRMSNGRGARSQQQTRDCTRQERRRGVYNSLIKKKKQLTYFYHIRCEYGKDTSRDNETYSDI